MAAKKKTAKKTTKKTTKRIAPSPGSRKKAAEAFLNSGDFAGTGSRRFEVQNHPDVQAVVDLANKRRLAGENLNLMKICIALKNRYKLDNSPKTIRSRVLEYVERSVW